MNHINTIVEQNNTIINELHPPTQLLEKEYHSLLLDYGVKKYLKEIRSNRSNEWPKVQNEILTYTNQDIKKKIKNLTQDYLYNSFDYRLALKKIGISFSLSEKIRLSSPLKWENINEEEQNVLIKSYLSSIKGQKRQEVIRTLSLHETQKDLYFAQYKAIVLSKNEVAYEKLTPHLQETVNQAFLDDLENHHQYVYKKVIQVMNNLDNYKERLNHATKLNIYIQEGIENGLSKDNINLYIQKDLNIRQSQIIKDALLFGIDFEDVKLFSDKKYNYKVMREAMFALLPDKVRNHLSHMNNKERKNFTQKYNMDFEDTIFTHSQQIDSNTLKHLLKKELPYYEIKEYRQSVEEASISLSDLNKILNETKTRDFIQPLLYLKENKRRTL